MIEIGISCIITAAGTHNLVPGYAYFDLGFGTEMRPVKLSQHHRLLPNLLAWAASSTITIQSSTCQGLSCSQ